LKPAVFIFMICLLVAATALEISPFLECYRSERNQLPDDLHLDILITGIGLTATTYSITKQIQIRRPDIIIQAGIGGCFNQDLVLGSVVAIKQEAIGDQAVIEKGDVLKRIKLRKVKGITINEITTSKKKIKLYQDIFDPVIESLEGAALHYICLMEKIQFLQIRSASNYIGERNKKNWNMKDSIGNLNKEIIRLLKTI